MIWCSWYTTIRLRLFQVVKVSLRYFNPLVKLAIRMISEPSMDSSEHTSHQPHARVPQKTGTTFTPFIPKTSPLFLWDLTSLSLMLIWWHAKETFFSFLRNICAFFIVKVSVAVVLNDNLLSLTNPRATKRSRGG